MTQALNFIAAGAVRRITPETSQEFIKLYEAGDHDAAFAAIQTAAEATCNALTAMTETVLSSPEKLDLLTEVVLERIFERRA